MAKITINPITGSYASVVAINNRFAQLEIALNDNILWRGGFTGEPNAMSVDLDLDGNALLNLDVLNSTISGGSIADGVSWAQEWAIAIEGLLITTAAGGNGVSDYSSLHWAAKSAADVISTNSDVISTGLDVIATGLDVVSTNGDVVSTGLDVGITNADVVSTNADVVSTNSDVIITNADVLTTNGDVISTNADVLSTNGDVLVTNADAITTSGDVIITNADVVVTNADVVLTNADVSLTNAKYTQFDDRYLGSKAVAPTTLNDGSTALAAAHEGIEYWNSATNDRWTWSGTAWGLTSSSVATSANLVAIADAGGYYTGTDVEAALQEIQDEGVWTPEIQATTDGTGWTYIGQRGQWKVVGTMLFMSFSLRTSNVSTGSSGVLSIVGMPTKSTQHGSDCTGLLVNLDTGLSHSSTGYTSFIIIGNPNNSALSMAETGEAGINYLATTDLTGGVNISGSIVIGLQ